MGARGVGLRGIVGGGRRLERMLGRGGGEFSYYEGMGFMLSIVF